MKNNSKASGSVRLLRVGETIRHALSDILTRDIVHDPILYGVSITVTEADVSPDLRSAVIYIQPLGGEGADEKVAALNNASGFLRGQLGKMVHIKYLPKLTFALDKSFDVAGHMNKVFADPKVRQDLGAEISVELSTDSDKEETQS
jgi:ribosome-binding factor A